jgi:hypothetical protein
MSPGPTRARSTLPAARRGAWQRLRARAPLLLAAALLAWGLAGRPVRSAEFITPPGVNVEGQEAVLKEQVTRLAKDLVGDALVDVVVGVRYVRTDGTGGQRIKLPGVNHYITPGPGGGANIVAGHVRVRQVLVMVSEKATGTPEALAQEIRQQGHFDPAQGDLVRVVKVAAGGQPVPAATAATKPEASLNDDTQQLSRRLKQERSKQDDERASQELGKMMAQGSLAEAQSTTYLIRARQAFFNGDYDRALEQILQSISQNANNPQAYAMLGSLYYAVDWKQLALKYWEKSLTLDPDNRELRDLVAKLRSSPNT